MQFGTFLHEPGQLVKPMLGIFASAFEDRISAAVFPVTAQWNLFWTEAKKSRVFCCDGS